MGFSEIHFMSPGVEGRAFGSDKKLSMAAVATAVPWKEESAARLLIVAELL